MSENLKIEVDYKDLEAKYAVDDSFPLDRYVLIDGLPVIPESKADKLLTVLAKLFAKVSPPVGGKDGLKMPIDAESGKSFGYAFVSFASEADAMQIVKNFNHKKLDPKHTMLVDKLSTVMKYLDMQNVEYKEPVIPEFKPLPHLKQWLTDSLQRDQAAIHSKNGVAVQWFRKNGASQDAMPAKQDFTENFVQWSPSGTYLVSVHTQGISLHAGPNFDVVARFPHRDAKLVDFSPDEKYLITGSRTPLKVGGPFKESDEGNNIIVWSVEAQQVKRSFPLPKSNDPSAPPQWPSFQWSANSQFFARIPEPNYLAIYDVSNMSLVGKKALNVSGIGGYSFAPVEINKQQLLAYWVPEAHNQTAKVCIINAATKEVVHNRSLFNVVSVELYWQNEGRFLCSRVDRLTKNKKFIYSSLEVYRLQEKDIPIEVLEFQEKIFDVAWEPNSDRFVTVGHMDPVPSMEQQLKGHRIIGDKYTLNFFALERQKKLHGTWKESNKLVKRPRVQLKWSPRGRFLTTVAKAPAAMYLEFFDVEHDVPVKDQSCGALPAAQELPINVCLLKQTEHATAAYHQWDPSGRFMVTHPWAGNGTGPKRYILWDFAGRILREQAIDGLMAFIWRPRPASQLTKEQRKLAGKRAKELGPEFDSIDAQLAANESDEFNRAIESVRHSWSNFRNEARKQLEKYGLLPEECLIKVENGVVYVPKVVSVDDVEEIVD